MLVALTQLLSLRVSSASNWVSHVTTLLLGPGGWIELSYGNGTQYSSHCGQSGRVARILFDCDPFAGKVTEQYNGMFRKSQNDCHYIICDTH